MPFVGIAQINTIFSVKIDDERYVENVCDAVWKDLGPNASMHLRQYGEVAIRVIFDSLRSIIWSFHSSVLVVICTKVR